MRKKKPAKPKVMFMGVECWVEFGKYDNGSHSIQLMCNTDGHDEPMATATVYLPHVELMTDEVLLKGWSENSGLPEALAKAGIVELKDVWIPTGFVMAQKAWLLVEVA